jgi:hypothetical protein
LTGRTKYLLGVQSWTEKSWASLPRSYSKQIHSVYLILMYRRGPCVPLVPLRE